MHRVSSGFPAFESYPDIGSIPRRNFRIRGKPDKKTKQNKKEKCVCISACTGCVATQHFLGRSLPIIPALCELPSELAAPVAPRRCVSPALVAPLRWLCPLCVPGAGPACPCLALLGAFCTRIFPRRIDRLRVSSGWGVGRGVGAMVIRGFLPSAR